MKEILGQGLKLFFKNSNLDGIPTYIGEQYEVWVVEDGTFVEMSEMQEETFCALCPEGWWRYSPGSVLGTPDDVYKVNGHDLLAWNEKHNQEYCCRNCQFLNNICNGEEEDIDECYGDKSYKNLIHYINEEIGASTEKNVCAIAMDLAKYNGLSLGELFQRYQE